MPSPAPRPGLDCLFSPRAVAVIGASGRPGSIGGEIFKNLLEAGFEGPVYPVNPKAEHVRSVRAYPRVTDVPGPVDLAVVVVPAPAVAAAVADCGAKGVTGLVVISAGFGEIGGEGLVRQDQLRELIERFGMRMIGPNCLGLLNTSAAVRLNATFAPHYPPAGRVAFASQSGALGVAILDHAKGLGIGISTFVSIGNRVDVTLDELLAYWRDDLETDVILLYLESFGDPRRFSVLAREVSRVKPIVAVKGGRTVAGARAASSHTGSLAGGDRAVGALLQQAGVIRVDSVEELFDMAMLLDNEPLPKGPRLAILTNAGGPGILATDAAETYGLTTPGPSETLRDRLGAFLPKEASLANPIDMIAGAGPDEFGKATRLIVESGEFDALIVMFVPPVAARTDEVARQIVAAVKGSTIPAVTCFLGTHGVPEALRTLEGGGVPSYRYPEAAVRALGRALAYSRWRERRIEPAPVFNDVNPRRGMKALGERTDDGWLSPDAAKELLAAYGIAHVETRFAASEEEAAHAAEALGLPVVMKIVAEGVLHKSDVQGVQVDLRDARAVRHAFRSMRAALEAHGKAAAFRGVELQPMVQQGVEIAVGVALDGAFGHLVMVGTGGVNLEVLNDVRFGLHPLSATDVDEMITSLRGAPLLKGYRGRPPADVWALRQLVLRVDRMLADRPEIVEMDLNPVMVQPAGRGAIVVDVRVKVRAG